MLAVNVAAVHAVLEYARTENAKLRLVYGNSAKILAAPLHGEINESWPTAVSCLYSLGKMSALELIRHYRRHHGIKAANLVLFNHESARRPKEYFLPTVAAGLSRARRDRTHVFAVKTLDFLVDWSSAQELMDISVDIAEQAPDQDFVLASGRTVHARQVVEAWFQRHGLDYRRHVSESLATAEPGPAFRVDTTFLQQRVGRRPVRDLDEILDEIDSAADTGA
jgi:GDPmannose 4,6-dehydratase